jgi:hypothetical protein
MATGERQSKSPLGRFADEFALMNSVWKQNRYGETAAKRYRQYNIEQCKTKIVRFLLSQGSGDFHLMFITIFFGLMNPT